LTVYESRHAAAFAIAVAVFRAIKDTVAISVATVIVIAKYYKLMIYKSHFVIAIAIACLASNFLAIAMKSLLTFGLIIHTLESAMCDLSRSIVLK